MLSSCRITPDAWHRTGLIFTWVDFSSDSCVAENEHISTGRRDAEARSAPRIAITMGDPNGIGPEVMLKCLSEATLYEYVRPVVIGSRSMLEVHAARMGMHPNQLVNFTGENFGLDRSRIPVYDHPVHAGTSVQWGQISAEGGAASIEAVTTATDMCLSGTVDAMVTAPLSKKAVAMAGYKFNGHTAYIAERCAASSHLMVMVSGTLRVGLVTGHIPLSAVAEHVNRDMIVRRLKDFSVALKTDFDITSPSIAVLGLNPHAGEEGLLGNEEVNEITPAISGANASGINASGPFSADGFFGTRAYERYDAVLAMYHDQGLIPFKTLSFESGINYTAGLPIVRTSPDHGTAFSLAGKGQASHGSMKQALKLASQIVSRRIRARQEVE